MEETASSGRIRSKSIQRFSTHSCIQAAGLTSPDGLTSSSSATNGILSNGSSCAVNEMDCCLEHDLTVSDEIGHVVLSQL